MPRPKPDVAAVSVLLRLHPDTLAAIDAARGDTPRTMWIRALINSHVAARAVAKPEDFSISLGMIEAATKHNALLSTIAKPKASPRKAGRVVGYDVNGEPIIRR